MNPRNVDTADARRAEQLRALGFAIARQRELRNISQTDMATMLGYTSHSYLSRVESGKKAPNVALIFEIAEILEVDPITFFTEL